MQSPAERNHSDTTSSAGRVLPLEPPEPTLPDGTPRRVGVEIEFAGLDAADTSRLVRYIYGGRIEIEDEHRRHIVGTSLGDFTVELDWFAAHGSRKNDEQPKGTLDEIEEKIRAAVGDVGSMVMPYEISCPPVPIDKLTELDALVEGLRRSGAQGTEGRFFYAFGLHFNPEASRRDADGILNVLKSYLLLSSWLREQMDIDMARRVAPFVHRFPDPYAALVLEPDYRPDLLHLARDYMHWNPSRNRELDLYPLFACIVPEALTNMRSDPHVKARPTWHWRLPDSRVGVPGWSIVPDWNRWVQVERLSIDGWALDELGAMWRERWKAGALTEWPGIVQRWMAP